VGRGGPRRAPVGPHSTRAHPARRRRASAAAHSRGLGLGARPRGLLRRPLTGPALCLPGARPLGRASLPAALHLRPPRPTAHCARRRLSHVPNPHHSMAQPPRLLPLECGSLHLISVTTCPYSYCRRVLVSTLHTHQLTLFLLSQNKTSTGL
jgi:hypothetical protein